MIFLEKLRLPALAGGLVLLLTACGSDSPSGSDAGGPPVGERGVVFEVCGSNEEVRDRALIAFFEAREGDTIEFCAGRFELDTGLIVHGRRGVTIRGQGMRETVLNFLDSDSAEGINVSHSDGIVIEGLSVEDTPGNGIRVFRSQFVTMRDVRVSWRDPQGRFEDEPGYTPQPSNGAYALYPVETEHVLIEDCEAHGASDAGVYVGQSNDVIVRRCLATYNVAGYEFENTYRSIFEDNEAYDNTGGFLVFDLPGLRQYGESNIVRNNISCRNNTDNFAPVGNIVGLVPRGTGMLVVSADTVDIHDNEICDNDSFGIAIVSFGLVDPNESDMKFDFFSEGVQIYRNRFRDNGGAPQMPDLERGEASALPLLIILKNMLSLPQIGTSAHIVWDGAIDAPSDCDEIPVDSDGVPLTEPNPNPSDPRLEARTDPRGRPNVQRSDPTPSCRWNAWKFDESGELKAENRLWIGDDNTFENTRLATALVRDFFAANLTTSALPDIVFDILRPGSNNPAPYTGVRPLEVAKPELQLPFIPNPNSAEARPTPARVQQLCGSGAAGSINRAALAEVNCRYLDQYGLFGDAGDPLSTPRGHSVPYTLSSPLFTDYAVKARAVHLPDGARMGFRESTSGGPITNSGATATLDFPVGTVISKTFSFRQGDADQPLETRLLIKRETANGVHWVGLPYRWEGEGSQRRAVLRIEGARLAGSYDYADPDPEVDAQYAGEVTHYSVPAALNCITCHGGDNRTSGAAPIGPKVRLLNTEFDYGSGPVNQLQYMQQNGFLDASNEQVQNAERLPRWNVPGDSGHQPDSDMDIHVRARAYLETNCMHCHQPGGNASNSGLFLDSFRTVGRSYGVCKRPVAAGRGSGDRQWVIVPGDASASIMHFRSASTEPGVRMPPIARSVNDNEAVQLIHRWIDDVLPRIDGIENDSCSGPLGGLFP